jgi:hypothetical protein
MTFMTMMTTIAERLLLAASVSLLATAGCASLTAEQQAAVAKVQVINREPERNCQNLGAVSGSADSMGPGGIRAKAVLLGGNTVYVDAHGVTTAFYCPGTITPRAEVPIL